MACSRLSFFAEKVFQLAAHLLTPAFQILQLIFHIFCDVVKSDRVGIVHIIELLPATRFRYYDPGYQVGKYANAGKEQEYHDQPNDSWVNIKVVGYAATYTTQHFIVWIAQHPVVRAHVWARLVCSLLIGGRALSVVGTLLA